MSLFRRKQEPEDPLSGKKAGQPIAVTPIGVVRNRIREFRSSGWETVESEIAVWPEFEAALEGIEGFSHLLVLFWLDQVAEEGRLLYREEPRIHPKGRTDLPRVGIFATRTQNRPNPIGLTVIRLLGRQGTRLRVLGLDARDGTPVLDLKPYIPPYDALPDASLPDWATRG